MGEMLSKPEPKGPSLYTYSEENYLRFEALLRRHGLEGRALWSLRNDVFCALTESKPILLRLRFGFWGSLVKTLLLWKAARRQDFRLVTLSAKYILLASGTQSKELDMPRAIGAELIRRGESVAIIHYHFGKDPSPLFTEFPNHCRIISLEQMHNIGLGELISCIAKVFGEMWHLRFLNQEDASTIFRLLFKSGSLFEILRDLFLAEKFFLKFLDQNALRGVAVVSEDAPLGRGLVKTAHHWGAQAFHFLHGFPHIQHTSAEADHIFCFSQLERDLFLNAGWPESGVHAFGHCRSEIIAKDVTLRRLKPSHGDGLRLLFAEQAVEGDYDETAHRNTLSCLLEGAAKANLTPKEMRIRIHPRSNRETINDIAAQCGIPNVASFLSSRPLADDLAWSNVVATAWSTMSVESAWAGSSLIWLPMGTFSFPLRDKLVQSGYGSQIKDATSLAQMLDQFRNPDYRTAATEALHSAACKYSIVSQHAVEESVDLMLRATHQPC